MTLRQFQTLQLVVKEGSFSKAAQRLGISQPAISKHIFTLEAKLGFDLFRRRRGGAVELTSRGSAILEQVASLMKSAANVAALAEMPARRQQQTVRITAGRFLANYVILPNLAQLRILRPDIIVELTSLDSPRRAFEPAHRENADLIYVSLSDPALVKLADLICVAPVVFAASPSHPVVAQILDGAAVRLPMIMGVPGDSSDTLIRHILKAANIGNYYAAHSVQLPEVMVSLAVAGEGVCCVMPPMIRDQVRLGTLVELDLPHVLLHRCAVYNELTLNDDIRYVDRFVRQLILAADVPAAA